MNLYPREPMITMKLCMQHLHFKKKISMFFAIMKKMMFFYATVCQCMSPLISPEPFDFYYYETLHASLHFIWKKSAKIKNYISHFFSFFMKNTSLSFCILFWTLKKFFALSKLTDIVWKSPKKSNFIARKIVGVLFRKKVSCWYGEVWQILWVIFFKIVKKKRIIVHIRFKLEENCLVYGNWGEFWQSQLLNIKL